ncbi:MAG: PLP-dependent transferase, partial [Akkermansiaceae bacterium]|nr:PLP-dependent transferase [Akkermansiaceae bacterium]
MAAIFTLYRIVTGRRPGRQTLQLCFPYVDALKIQELFGSGVTFVPEARGRRF